MVSPMPRRPSETMSDVQIETRDRVRRIETRMTKFMEAHGFDTQVQRPTWNGGVIHAPTSSISLRDCLAVIPDSWDRREPVAVLVKDDLIAYLIPGSMVR